MNQHQQPNPQRSVLATLRELVPERPLRQAELLQLAERQASRFRLLTGSLKPALDADVVVGLPRIRVDYRQIPTSGMSYWDGEHWVIALNATEPRSRQLFTLMHEYKHIVDHPFVELLYRDTYRRSGREQAEQAADYFAGCVLLPGTLLRDAWGEGVRTLGELAHRFGTSPRAVEVRLSQLGLIRPVQRCDLPVPFKSPRPGTFYRAAHPLFASEGVAA